MLIFNVESKEITFAAGRKKGAIFAPPPLSQHLNFIQCKSLCSAGCTLQVFWNCDTHALHPD